MSHYDVDTESIVTDMLSVASSPSNASTATLTTVAAADEPPPYSLIEDSTPRLWAGHDPRSSSTQSLGEYDNPPQNKRKLLLIYIHGFMGAETSFQSYPAHVHNLVSVLLGESHVISTKVYPRYRSRRSIQVACNDFSTWLSPHESPDTDIVLLGHSLGGILAAEVALLPCIPFDYNRPLRHRILGTINFDTPFLGMHPGVVKSGLGSIFRPAPSPEKSPYATPPGTASTSNSSFNSPYRADTLHNPQPIDPNFNPTFTNDVFLPVRTGWKNAQHFLRKHSKNIVSATSSLVMSHLEFSGCLADYDGLRARYCRIRMLDEEFEHSRSSVVSGTRPTPRVRFANYYTASTGRRKSSTNQGTSAPPSLVTESSSSHSVSSPSVSSQSLSERSLAAYGRPPSIISTSTPSIASTELPPYQSEPDDSEDDDVLSIGSEEDLSDFADDDGPHAGGSANVVNNNVSLEKIAGAGPGSQTTDAVISAAEPSESVTIFEPLPDPPILPVAPPHPAGDSINWNEYRNSLKKYYGDMKDYHRDFKNYHRALRNRRRTERKSIKQDRKDSINSLKEELKILALTDKETHKDEEKQRVNESLKGEQKRHMALNKEERKKESDQRKAEFKERMDMHKQIRKNEIDRRQAEHKAWLKQTSEDRKTAMKEIRAEHKATMQAVRKEKGKAKSNQKDCSHQKKKGSRSASSSIIDADSVPDPLPRTSSDSAPMPFSTVPIPQGPYSTEEKSKTLGSTAANAPKDKRFCNLPPMDASGNRDPAWVRVYMEGVDEVGAHCGLFFPATSMENPDPEQHQWGERYARLVGDVAERIESWVQDYLTETLVRHESAQAAAEIAEAPPLPPRNLSPQETGVMSHP